MKPIFKKLVSLTFHNTFAYFTAEQKNTIIKNNTLIISPTKVDTLV